MNLTPFPINPICSIRTPFSEKFGVPRQSRLAPSAWGVLEFPKDDFYMEAFRGIEEFSHLWLIFLFHEVLAEGPRALVRPPRFQGKEKWGVFATRSPHRPNHIGMSVVEFVSLEIGSDRITLRVRGVDLVDKTPILDIRPYIPYCDAIHNAKAGPFEKPKSYPVRWDTEFKGPVETRNLIEEVISLDPRSGNSQESFGVTIDHYNIRFHMSNNEFVIESALKVEE